MAQYSGVQGGNKVPEGYSSGQMQQFTPEQMELFQSMFSNLGPDSFLGKLAGGDQSMFAEMEAPAMEQFSGIQGNLASKFSGMGAGARGSSGFQNTMNQAGSDFAQQLQGNRMEMRQNAIKELMGFSDQLLGQKPYEQTLTEKPKSFWEELLIASAGGASSAATSAMMG